MTRELNADVVVVGGSLGGCAAALAACRLGATVVMSEETPWFGGQLTSQTVPPDEHRYIETFGSSDAYRELRRRIRDYYRRNFPLTADARSARWLNPGRHECSSLACEPRAGLAALTEMLAPHVHSGRLRILTAHEPVGAETDADQIRSVRVRSRLSGELTDIAGRLFLDATELGDLLELSGAEHVIGAEPQEETDEPSAIPGGNPRCQMCITWCLQIDHVEGEDHTIARPAEYDFFRTTIPPHWPNPQLSFVALDYDTMGPWQHTFLPVVEDGPLWESLWTHRRMIAADQFAPGTYVSDILHVNWTQNDYFWGPIVGVDEEERRHHLEMSRQLSLSLLYWLQTEAPRPDGGAGWPGLRLRGDVSGTEDGLAMYPYIREARRIRAETTMLEQHISAQVRTDGAVRYPDAVGVGYYFLDMHQRTEEAVPFLIQTWPFQIPLGSLIHSRVQNLLASCKNIGVTHVVNSATRLHPIEWVIGEAAGTTAAYCVARGVEPAAVRADEDTLADLQSTLVRAGVEIEWPSLAPVRAWHEHLRYTVDPDGARL
ncbi:MAG: FAD-dependent oxidoreductase [Thermoleophilia bacterium]|nr:FAD-dependent oxidoreductase [Thermoleophilia bacterium]MDH5282242.1 FAD-dependent oxidoreductase [Thermoleophilia bacterium]